MRVYRCITAREITNLYQGNSERKALVKGDNTHNYHEGVSYIHFFRFSQSAEYYLKKNVFSMHPLDRYITYMTANIPNDILNQYSGYGLYGDNPDIANGYTMPLPEYALPEEVFKKDYIVSINNFIEYDYQSNQEEYDKYCSLVEKLAEQYDYNFFAVARYLNNHNLSELLNIKEENRTESEIFDDKIKELCKNWKGYD